MASLSSPILILGFLLCVLLISPAQSQTCKTQRFSGNRVFANCSDLPSLTSYLHWSYDASNSSLAIAFVAPPSKANGWVAWAINPTGTGMIGSQALVAVRRSNGSVTVQTYNISSYAAVVPSSISFEVWDLSATYAGGQITIFATVKVPEKAESLNQVWQVGPGVNETTGLLEKHDVGPANLAAKGTLSLATGTTTNATAPGSAPAPSTGTGGSGNGTGNSTTGGGKSGAVSVIASCNVLGWGLVSILVLLAF
ncbi:DOMON domain containing protein [Trema orientale]|uniref:DOMON domain containing protein n=1 Tax=Trema orientale TaxID=63057 RepID=A0A2P5B2Q5_TREOI|nr:DOMON domain containing protein [Trema orientale]